MFLCRKAERENFCQYPGLIAFGIHHIDDKIVLTELPHYLTADTAGRETAGDHTVVAAADSNGGKIPVTVINCLEEGGTFGAVGGTVGSVFNVNWILWHRTAQQEIPTVAVAPSE